jgi:hypothetical protein
VVAGSGVEITRDRVAQVLKGLDALHSQGVFVGISDTEAARKESGKVTNALLGYWHENGVPSRNIPPRPFLRPGVASVQPQIISHLRAAGAAALDGNVTEVTRQYKSMGQLAASAVQRKIVDGPFAPLAPRTVEARKARGRKPPFLPLIDTGQLRRAVTWVLRRV